VTTSGYRRLPFAVCVTSVVLACQTKPSGDPFPGPVRNAEFGVFYGGQVQERDQIPLVVDQTKQSHGIRIEFEEPLKEELTIHWELDMPGTTRGVRDERGVRGRGRLVKHDQAIVPRGRSRFDQVLGFEPGDPVGMWNVRVRVEDQVVIDRPFEVVRPDR
jgi:hypothetical protein